MREVKIAELKARLSHYLRLVHKGEEILVKHRERPVARMVAISNHPERLEVIPAKISLKDLDAWVGANPGPEYSRITPQDFDETLQWHKRDVWNKWFGDEGEK